MDDHDRMMALEKFEQMGIDASADHCSMEDIDDGPLRLCAVARTDNDVAAIVEDGRIDELVIAEQIATSECLANVFDLTNLRSLSLSAATLSGTVFSGIEQLPLLERLEIVDLVRDADEALSHIAQCSSLETLELYTCAATAEGYGRLASSSRLKHLEVTNAIIACSLSGIGKIATLESLDIISSFGFYEGECKHLSRLTRLKELVLSHLEFLGTPGFKHLRKLTSLRELELNFTNLDDELIEGLAELTQLEYLSITACQVSRSAIEEVSRSLPSCVIDYSYRRRDDTPEPETFVAFRKGAKKTRRREGAS